MLKPSLRTSPHGTSPAGSGMIRDRVSLATLTTYLSRDVLERIHLPNTFLEDYVVRPRWLNFPHVPDGFLTIAQLVLHLPLEIHTRVYLRADLRYLSESSTND
jgi:hypothetical protein